MKYVALLCLLVLQLHAQNITATCPPGYLTVDTMKPCAYQQKDQQTALWWQIPPQGLLALGYIYLEDTRKATTQVILTALVPIIALFAYFIAPSYLKQGASVARIVALAAGLTFVAPITYTMVGVFDIIAGTAKDGRGQPLKPR